MIGGGGTNLGANANANFGANAASAPPSVGALTLRSAAQSGSLVKYAPADFARPGLCAEIAAAMQRVDPQLRLDGMDRLVPLRRLELMLASDELDVFFCLLASERRREMMRFLPVPLYRVRHVIMMRAGEPAPQTWTALRAFARRKPLLLVQGTQLAVALQQADVAHVETARSESDALQMLLRGRTDAVYGQDLALRHAMRTAGIDEGRIQFGPQAFEEQPQFAVVSRHLPEPVVERLTERLRQLQASGELARIVDRYR
ncbi:ABC-type amino acid transport substrate-binding protein [Roseateles sp. YR242]|uniref:substrate-binding periplasmic protein n=1 Tax=Roseateles sp. YR242 TaxID=1855305 RepID=UPI0008CB18EB|nr:transporter substrate-binding domain-containing protein [Roseateles sp. YR242]SEL53048.1 ABC-type amino acid transport substrate-binding protein [Roseateles sp. YR242]